MSEIRFSAAVRTVASVAVICLPKEASEKLSSRGMDMAKVTIHGTTKTVALEPGGRVGHWFFADAWKAKPGEAVEVTLEPTNDWPDPDMPKDIMNVFLADPVSKDMWGKITPKARWEWLRWIRSTNNPETRAKRIKVSIDKMHKGMRRPCCFNQNMCTVPEVSKNGQLVAEQV